MRKRSEIQCSQCGTEYMRTASQVNQSIKKRGAWSCVSCAGAPNKMKIAGQKFSKLLVVSYAGVEDYGSNGTKTRWQCLCDCGKVIFASGSLLRSGKKRSCGCDRVRVSPSKTHGRTGTREYRAWMAMKNRCRNPKFSQYKDYGGRGIRFCERWESFESFFADMGACPIGNSIDRIDVNGNYEPSNCRWSDRKTQARNTRVNRRITFNGTTKCLKEWSEELEMDQSSLAERIQKWGTEKALTTPKKGT